MNSFPDHRYKYALDFQYDYAEALNAAMQSVRSDHFHEAAEVLRAAYQRRAHVFTCGNGGSASVANHLACDHVKGIRNGTALAPRVTSLVSNTELLTAIANDIGYADVFRYQLESLASPEDVLVAVSSSGESANICNAIQWANDHCMHTIALTGFDGGEAWRTATVKLHVNSHNYGIVEDAHQAIMHALAQFIRQAELPKGTHFEETVF